MKRIRTCVVIGAEKIGEGDIEKMIIKNISSEILESMSINYQDTDDPNISIVEAYIDVLDLST